MKVLLYIILILIILLLFALLKQMKKNIVFTILCSMLIICFVLYPKFCMNSTITGVSVFFKSVFPSLFPFMIICNILLFCDGVNLYSKLFGKELCTPLNLPQSCSFVLIVSILCGYPLGAKYTMELYEKKMLTSQQAERLLNIASNASPLFVIGTVGSAMFSSTKLGYILLISNYLSCFFISFFLPGARLKYRKPQGRNEIPQIDEANLGEILKNSINNSVTSCLSIGGYITIFFVTTDIIKNNVLYNMIINNLVTNNSLRELISGLLLGSVEMTKGCFMISGSSSSLILRIASIGFLLGFSGLSITSQVYSFTYSFAELSIKKYLKRKLLQGLICSAISTFLYLFITKLSPVRPTFSQATNTGTISIVAIALLLVIPFMLYSLKKLFHVS